MQKRFADEQDEARVTMIARKRAAAESRDKRNAIRRAPKHAAPTFEALCAPGTQFRMIFADPRW